MAKSHVLESQTAFEPRLFRSNLLDWYNTHHRTLPWRSPVGETSDPYHVWLSEIMLQQTTVAAVIPYFEKFVTLWPDIHAFAQAPDHRVMAEWAGLGYYARARNMHVCAKIISQDMGGAFPRSERELLALPGIGPYTAAAIASIAFGQPCVVVDGNIERVTARYFALKDPLPMAKARLKDLAAQLYEGIKKQEHCQHFPQALMDLGAMICTPKSPKCSLCPLARSCCAHAGGTPESYPVKALRKKVPTRTGKVYWLTTQEGHILIEKRPAERMLGGMNGLPTTDWDQHGGLVDWESVAQDLAYQGKVTHVFSHFKLELDVFTGRVNVAQSLNKKSHMYVLPKCVSMNEVGFPSLFQKVAAILG